MNDANQWNKYADIYDQTQGEEGDIAHRLVFDPNISKLLGDVTGKVILDAGCGNGYWVRNLARRSSKVIGIDSSEKLIDICKSKNNPSNVEYKVMDLTDQLDFPDEVFDLILSSLVFQYMPSLDKTASEFNRILKYKGEVVVCAQHPIYQYHFRVQQKLGKKLEVFPETAGYFDRKYLKQKVLAGKALVDNFNRPLKDYLSPFLDHGFVLTDFEEPEFTEEILREDPRYQEVREIPRVVIFKLRKEPTSVTGKKIGRGV